MKTLNMLMSVATTTAVFSAGCTASSNDKAGSDTLELRLVTIDEIDNNGYSFGPRTFVSALSAVSGGRIQVEVETGFGDGGATAESDLVEAIAAGEFDGGWPSTRAFAGAGIQGMAAVEAPFTLTSYKMQSAVATGDVAELLLANLDDTDIVGLGLAVGPLRRPFGVEAFLTSAADWKGARIRSYNSPVQSATVDALGGTPVEMGFEWVEKAQSGELDGVELDLAQYLANGYRAEAGKVASNVVLWPKMFVLSLSRETWDGLSDEQRGWVSKAADEAVAASVNGDYGEDEIAADLCERGVRFRQAEPAEMAGLRSAVQPVLENLASNPADGPVLQAVQEVALLAHDQDALRIPDGCSERASGSKETEIPASLAPIPDGTYRKQISEEEVAAAGLSNNDGTSGVWTLTLTHGRFEVTCRPLESPGLDCGNVLFDGSLDIGELRGDESTVWWVTLPELLAEANGCALPPSNTTPGHCPVPEPFQMTWSMDGDDLVFRDATGGGYEVTLKAYQLID